MVGQQKSLSNFTYYDVSELARLPYSIQILAENVARKGGKVEEFAKMSQGGKFTPSGDIEYYPARVLMQDFTGVPAVVDLAAMRDACVKRGKNPDLINPIIQTDLVIDHSVQIDFFGGEDSQEKNVEIEIKRNIERYRFLKWAQQSFSNFSVVPLAQGICHQVNIEYLAKVVFQKEEGDKTLLYPDTVVGTDSHTTMVNGLGVLGWGVGGIEAESAMLGQSISITVPEVIGVKLTGKLSEGVMATDLVLKITEELRKLGVVNKFVEFYGDGVANLSLADRATISNMSPEFGSTCAIFIPDEETLSYLTLTGRDESQVNLVRDYCKAQKMTTGHDRIYTATLDINLSEVVHSIAGPKRPQDRISLTEVSKSIPFPKSDKLDNGSVVIASITSCTNTSNPNVLIAAGLIAKKACELGLTVPSFVKTSFAPGSRAVEKYMHDSGLQTYLDQIGFNIVGFGCTTCIGNSGPLSPEIEEEIGAKSLDCAAVLSGNRNFEGRIHQFVKSNYLASPPLVVAYALAGHMKIDFENDPIGHANGKPVYLRDLWPSSKEISDSVASCVKRDIFLESYKNVYNNKIWNSIECPEQTIYNWDDASTYIENPPYFTSSGKSGGIKGAKALLVLGDSVTTDHISPAGSIAKHSPAGQFLIEKGVDQKDFNSYGARRGSWSVMVRGTFANIRIRNKLCDKEGGYTTNPLTGKVESVYDTSCDLQNLNVPMVVIAGKEYGTGSSRDWAAKGTKLLGVKGVIAESFERIHRSNLIGMGVIPFVFKGSGIADFEFDHTTEYTISGLENDFTSLGVKSSHNLIISHQGVEKSLEIEAAVYTSAEIEYLMANGIMECVVDRV